MNILVERLARLRDGMTDLVHLKDAKQRLGIAVTFPPTAEADGQWTVHIDNETSTLPFPKWLSAYDAICEGKQVSVIRHNGSTCTLQDSDGDAGVNRVFGEMILDLMLQL